MNKSDIARNFSLAATSYDQHAMIQQEIGKRLLENVRLLKNPPKRILDLGSGTGFITQQLKTLFPESEIVGLDLAVGMTHYAKAHTPFQYINGDAHQLPIKTNHIDLVFSNFTLQWCTPLQQTFQEIARILKPGGTLFFSTLGPDTLQELHQSFAQVDQYTHVHPFHEMHNIGDILLKLRFIDPVMHREIITLQYESVPDLLKDLKNTGARNIDPNRRRGLMHAKTLAKVIEAYQPFKIDNLFPATYEVIYGHAFIGEAATHFAAEHGIAEIPADHIPLMDF